MTEQYEQDIASSVQMCFISLYSSVGRAGDCNVNVDIPRSLVRIQLERLRLCGRVVYGASLRHWSLRRREFESRPSQYTWSLSSVGRALV